MTDKMIRMERAEMHFFRAVAGYRVTEHKKYRNKNSTE
jgi:hypothetical protein